MKGYWHFPAIAAVISILTVTFSDWFIAGFLIWLLFLHYRQRLRGIPIIVSLAAFLFFYFYIPAIHSPQLVDLPEEEASVTGKINGNVTKTSKKVEFELLEQSSNNKILVIYFIDKKMQFPNQQNESLKHGAACRITGKLELPDSSTNPGQFNYQNYLLTKGISWQLIVDSLENMDCKGSSPLSKLYTIRSGLIDLVKKNVSPETGAWLNALVLGDDSALNESTVELFQRWGLSHILAISGLHVGLFISLLYLIMIKSTLFTIERAQWIMVIFLPFYAFIAGGEPSVWRASTMVVLFILLNKFNVKFSVTDALSIVFLLLILEDHYIVYNIGFQFSFLVTFGLLLSKRWFSQNNGSFFAVLKISFVAQMMILPLQLSYFYTFQPLSILLNVVVVPYFSLIVIPLMFILLFFSSFTGFITQLIDTFFVHINNLALSIIQYIDSIAYFPWIIGPISIWSTIMYYTLFILLMNYMQTKSLKLAFGYGAGISLLLVALSLKPYFSPSGSVTMLDIGQGDSFVIELPYRKAVIFIDAGAAHSFEDNKATDKNFNQIIKPYLYSKGISRIDAIFMSHEDIDHIGSVSFMIEQMEVETVIISDYFQLDKSTEFMWENKGVEIERVAGGEQIIIENQLFSILSPISNKNSTNDNSLVLHTELGGNKLLFTGDVGKETEKEIIKNYPDLKVDILKVSHHGSNTSTDQTFLDQINPKYALISVGENNFYGHPADNVISVLKKENVIIFRTDNDGAVRYQFEKDQGTFMRFLP
ncbi:DNA internalization-related competence protein ComEC/Rec2 [Virgibacillus oceani]|uniref:DNA internalization-related competence protein ComEC/Rec2 n=1 Tax=Virgibacillus oceani TaxID=1479511 RepID=A0A917LX90_9BACI|nr:DNA internalization-related competence protein ComEC/Rec2 [Virgibacillus oceani]GGG63196.1 DNA internalization-related competence protein ComEC/Rec2 [Virgibacillus oceani]